MPATLLNRPRRRHPAARTLSWRVAVALGTAIAAAPPVPAADEMGEIVVTVRRVEERLQDVPLAITAFTDEQIEQAGIDNLADVAAQTPGLQFFNAQGEFLPVPVIRGVAPTDIFGENNAAIFVDGVYVSGRAGLNFSQLDIARIEVVKGPVSALYGRNAFSGAINYVTKRPSPDFEAKTDATVGNRGKTLVKASVSGPLLGDALTGRAGVLYDEWDGSYDNPVPNGDDVGGYRYRTFQGSLLWQPNDDLDVLASAYYSNDEIDDSAITAVQANCEDSVPVDPAYQPGSPNYAPPYNPRPNNFCGTLPSLEDNDIPKVDRALGEDRDVVRASLNIDWTLDVGTLSFLTGYSNTEQSGLTDFSRSLGYGLPLVYCIGAAAPTSIGCSSPSENEPLRRFSTGLLTISPEDETREISQEIRFTSPGDEPVRYSVGGYYFDVTLDETDPGSQSLGTIPADLTRFCPCVPQSPVFYLAPAGNAIWYPTFGYVQDPNTSAWIDVGAQGDVELRRFAENETDAWSLFGSVEVDFLERFTARAEARFTKENKEATGFLYGEPSLDPGGPPTFTINAEDDWSYLSGGVSLKYRPSDYWMLYVSAARSEKSGGIDIDKVTLLAPDSSRIDEIRLTPFDSETIDALEVGAKGGTTDGFLTLDLSIFRNDWKDIVIPQVKDTDDLTGLPYTRAYSFSENSGDAEVWGWELQTNLALTDTVDFSLGVAWVDSVLDDAQVSTARYWPSFAPDGDVSGNKLLRESEWQGNASLSHRRQFRGEWDYYSRADVIYQDSWYVGNDNQGIVPSHTYVNLRLGFESSRYTVEFWADNVFENDEPVGAFRDIFLNNTNDIAQANPPESTFSEINPWRLTVSQPRLRTFGVTGRVRFGGAAR